uniref:PAT1 domain-containing protein n=1 Tax=Mesocestoides corti TaxID=53468 RepID=A0A5K3F9M0_MESCO
MESELDEFNDETFGGAEIGDWELEHEKFVSEFSEDELPPSPCEIPKFWESADLSDFWSAGDLDVSQSFDSVLNLEDTVNKLICDDELEDPAILDISKHPPRTGVQTPVSAVPGVNLNGPNIWAPKSPACVSLKSQSQECSQDQPDPLQNLLSTLKLGQNISTQSNLRVTSHQNESSTSNPTIGDALFPTLPKPSQLEPNLTQPPWCFLGTPVTSFCDASPELHKLLSSRFGLVRPQQILPGPSPLAAALRGAPPMPPRVGPLSRPTTPQLICPRLTAPPLIPPHSLLLRPFVPLPHPPKSPFTFAHHQIPHLAPLDTIRIQDVLTARFEADQPDPSDVDPRKGSWMSPHEQLVVLNYQVRSLSVGNPYVEDYYFAVKWLRMVAKMRERKLAEGVPAASLPPPYFHLSAPITSTSLISSDHHHRIAMRCRFIIVLGKRKKQLAVEQKPVLNNALKKEADAGPYATQLGRPTKSNINAQRIIADLSIATALGEEQKENYEAESVTSAAAVADKISTKKPASASFPSRQHQAVIGQRRRLEVLARIERLYATVLNIDETNVSLARIFVKNEESRNLMGHRLNLLKVLHRDLFFTSQTPPSPLGISATSDSNNTESGTGSLSTPSFQKTRHFILDIFEVPKGVRLFPLILRFLFPEDRQFCVSEFISQFAKVNGSAKGGLDAYAQILYGPIRDVIYRSSEGSKHFIRSCIQLPLSLNSLISGALEPNALAMFSSRLGVSLFLCLLDACARNSQRDDPSLFCELFFYACRIVGQLVHTDLPTPLENFPHFAQLDPQFLMPKYLTEAYSRNGLPQYGVLLRRLSVRMSSQHQQISNLTAPPQPPPRNLSQAVAPQNEVTLA